MKYPEKAVYSVGDEITLQIAAQGADYPIRLTHRDQCSMKLSEREGYVLMQAFQHYFGVKNLLRGSTPLPSSDESTEVTV